MSFQVVLITAVTSLAANKLRASLTLLGLVIGVAAVISMLSIGRGAQDAITERIQALGSNLLFVSAGGTTFGGIFGGQGSATTLTLDDAFALQGNVLAPSVKSVAPEITTNGQLVAGRENTGAQILGTTPEYKSLRQITVASGQFINETHLDRSSQVAVLGFQVAEDLFGNRDPVGQPVRINGRQFTVIGVLEDTGGGEFNSIDNRVIVPITTVYNRLEV